MKTPMQLRSMRRHDDVQRYVDVEFEKKVAEGVEQIEFDIPEGWKSEDLQIATDFLKLYGWDCITEDALNLGTGKNHIKLVVFPIDSRSINISECALISQLSENITIVNKNRVKTEESNPYEEQKEI